MSTFIAAVGAGARDAVSRQSGSNFDATGASLNSDSNTAAGSRGIVGMRFNSVTIGNGDTIDSATMDIEINNAAVDDVNIEIHCEAVDQPVNFTTDPDLVGRALTTASDPWVADSVGAGIVTSPDCSSPIQEQVDRAGWVNGNHLMMIFVANSDVNKNFRFAAFESTIKQEARITIDYTAATPDAAAAATVSSTQLERRFGRGFNKGFTRGLT